MIRHASFYLSSCRFSEPSLATWYYVLQGFYASDGKTKAQIIDPLLIAEHRIVKLHKYSNMNRLFGSSFLLCVLKKSRPGKQSIFTHTHIKIPLYPHAIFGPSYSHVQLTSVNLQSLRSSELSRRSVANIACFRRTVGYSVRDRGSTGGEGVHGSGPERL